MQVSPRSPRTVLGARQTRDLSGGKKKRSDAGTAERAFLQMALGGNCNSNGNGSSGLERRRYVDKHVDSAKRSHRRAVSLSYCAHEKDAETQSDEGRGQEEMPTPNRNAGSAAVLPTMSGSSSKVKRRGRRLPHTMRPSLSGVASPNPYPGEKSSSGAVTPSVHGKKHPKEHLMSSGGKLVDLGDRLNHRRANSWDPRNDALRRKSDNTSLEAALATRKG
jgi:hypothetical protein